MNTSIVHANEPDVNRLEWACWMASKGITVFRVEENSKRPLGGASWYVDNTKDPAQITEWFEDNSSLNFGLWLGEEFLVIDLDTKFDTDGWTGIDHFEAICIANGMADFRRGATLKVRTPSGGWHLYFKAPFPVANKNEFPSGIDVRGAIGYVVSPGSRIDAGKWRVVGKTRDIAPLPDWLEEFIIQPGSKDPNRHVPLVDGSDAPEDVEQALAWLKTAKPAIAGENGDDTAYDICCQLSDYGISETKAMELLSESSWNAKCRPPWDYNELEVKVKNSYRYAQNRFGSKAATLMRSNLMRCRPTLPPIIPGREPITVRVGPRRRRQS